MTTMPKRAEPRTYTVYLPGSHRLSSRSESAVLKSVYDALLAEYDHLRLALTRIESHTHFDVDSAVNRLAREALSGATNSQSQP